MLKNYFKKMLCGEERLCNFAALKNERRLVSLL